MQTPCFIQFNKPSECFIRAIICLITDPNHMCRRDQRRLLRKQKHQGKLLTVFRGIVFNFVIAFLVYTIGSNNRLDRYYVVCMWYF